MRRTAHGIAGVLLSAAMLCGGCATGGAASATAANATATGGNASLEVRFGLSLGIGDAVSKAAAETIGNIMSPAGGLKALTDAQRAEAVDKVVNAGREQAKKEGTELTEAQRTNLEKLAGEKIDEEAKKAGEAKP